MWMRMVEDGEKGLGLLRIQGKATWDEFEWLRMGVDYGK
jgi:hypothetical protein